MQNSRQQNKFNIHNFPRHTVVIDNIEGMEVQQKMPGYNIHQCALKVDTKIIPKAHNIPFNKDSHLSDYCKPQVIFAISFSCL